MAVNDIGPDPQSFNLEQQTVENTNYRTVAWSGRYLQLTLMSIAEGADIGLEMHPETDQFLRLDAGRGRVQMGPTRTTSSSTKRCPTDGASWCQPAPGTTSPISATTRCSSMRSMHPPITSPARFTRLRRRQPLTPTTSPPPGRYSRHQRPIYTPEIG